MQPWTSFTTRFSNQSVGDATYAAVLTALRQTYASTYGVVDYYELAQRSAEQLASELAALPATSDFLQTYAAYIIDVAGADAPATLARFDVVERPAVQALLTRVGGAAALAAMTPETLAALLAANAPAARDFWQRYAWALWARLHWLHAPATLGSHFAAAGQPAYLVELLTQVYGLDAVNPGLLDPTRTSKQVLAQRLVEEPAYLSDVLEALAARLLAPVTELWDAGYTEAEAWTTLPTRFSPREQPLLQATLALVRARYEAEASAPLPLNWLAERTPAQLVASLLAVIAPQGARSEYLQQVSAWLLAQAQEAIAATAVAWAPAPPADYWQSLTLTVRGEATDEEEAGPVLAGVWVQVDDDTVLPAGLAVVGQGRTDAQGRLPLRVARLVTAGAQAGAADTLAGVGRPVTVRVMSGPALTEPALTEPAATELAAVEVTIPPLATSVTATLPLALATSEPTSTLAEVAAAAGLSLTPLASFLATAWAGEPLTTLAQVRAIGGLAGRLAVEEPALGAAQAALVRQLDAYAQRELLSVELVTSQRLQQLGYTTVQAVAAADRTAFAAAYAALDSADDAALTGAALHRQATASTALARVLATTAAAGAASGYALQETDVMLANRRIVAPGGVGIPPELTPELAQTLAGEQLDCVECESAVSRLAYAAALLAYVQEHVTVSATSGPQIVPLPTATPRLLQGLLAQPLAELPVACAAGDTLLSQARLAVETLVRYRRQQPRATGESLGLAPPTQAPLLLAVYEALLQQLGLSHTELTAALESVSTDGIKRLAGQLGVAATRQALADAVYLRVGGGLPSAAEQQDEVLAGMVLDLPAAPDQQAQSLRIEPLTLAALYRRFGLYDPYQLPFAAGHTRRLSAGGGTGGAGLRWWRLADAQYGRHTDAAGLAYLVVERAEDVDTGQRGGTVRVYARPADESGDVPAYGAAWLVAEGVITAAPRPGGVDYFARLYPVGNSGLQGEVALDDVPPAAADGALPAYALSVLPQLTAARLAQIVARWRDEDHGLENPYLRDDDAYPLIDPDLMGPDDIRDAALRPGTAGAPVAYRLWLHRWAWLERLLPDPALDAATLTGLLAAMQVSHPLYAALPASAGGSSTWQPGPQAAVFWPASSVPAALAGQSLAAQLRALHTGQYEDAQHVVHSLPAGQQTAWRAAWHLAAPESERLVALLEAQTTGGASAEQLAEQLVEARDLLLHLVKQASLADWRAEERALDLQLTLAVFQPALTAPQEGRWNRQEAPPAEATSEAAAQEGAFAPSEGVPLLDPQRQVLADLADATWGHRQLALWQARDAQLRDQRARLLALSVPISPVAGEPARWNALLEATYPGLTVPTEFGPGPLRYPARYATLLPVQQALLGADAALQQTARTYLAEELRLTETEFGEWLDAGARELAHTASPDSWGAVADQLVRAWKRGQYASWQSEERALQNEYLLPVGRLSGPATSEPEAPRYWLFYKQRLQPWRASVAQRQQWADALALRGLRPLVDPDQLGPADFVQVASPRGVAANSPQHNPAYALYLSRQTAVASQQAARAVEPPLTASLLAELVGRGGASSPEAELQGLLALYEAGGAIAPRLRQLGLTVAQLTQLVHYQQLEATKITPQQQAAIGALLTQVWKMRQYGAWQIAERDVVGTAEPTGEAGARGLSLSYEYFQPVAGEASDQARYREQVLVPGRSDLVTRLAWERQLSGRTAEYSEVVGGGEQAVASVEDAHYRRLRDALLIQQTPIVRAEWSAQMQDQEGDPASMPATLTEAQVATWLESRLFFDLQQEGVQRTTRAVAAGQAVQQFLFALRNNVLPVYYQRQANGSVRGQLAQLSTQGQEQDLAWLASYEQWRAVLLTYLYPENLLQPALLPEQSGPFRQLVDAVRGATVLTEALACAQLRTYEAYVRDLGALELGAAVQVKLSTSRQAGVCALATTVQQPTRLHFARGGYSGQIYYQVLPEEVQAQGESTGWEPVPLLAQMGRLVGASVYRDATGARFVYVVAVAAQGAIVVQRLALATLSWNTERNEVKLSTSLPGWSAEAYQQQSQLALAERPDETQPVVLCGITDIGTKYSNINGTILDISAYVNPVYTAGPIPTGAPAGTPPPVQNTNPYAVHYGIRGYEMWHVSLIDAIADKTYIIKYVSNLKFFKNLELRTCVVFNKTLRFFINAKNYNGSSDTVSIIAPFQELLSPASVSSNYWPILNPALPQFRPPSGWTDSSSSGGASRLWFLGSSFNNLDEDNKAGLICCSWQSATANIHGSDSQAYFALLYQNTTGAMDFKFIKLANSGTANTLSVHNRASAPVEVAGMVSRLQVLTSLPPAALVSHLYPCFQYESELGLASPAELVPRDLSYQAVAGPAANPATPTDGIFVLPRAASGATNALPVSLPSLARPDDIPALLTPLTSRQQPQRQRALDRLYYRTRTRRTQQRCFDEAYHYAPLLLALELQRQQRYDHALTYYRLLYDFTLPFAATTSLSGSRDVPKRRISPVLQTDADAPTEPAQVYADVQRWLQEPDNPHRLAPFRRNAHTRYVVSNLAQALLGYADQEYVRGTGESVGRARQLYELARTLLDEEVGMFERPTSAERLAALDVLVSAPAWQPVWQRLRERLAGLNHATVLTEVLDDGGAAGAALTALFRSAASTGAWAAAFAAAQRVVAAAEQRVVGYARTLGQVTALNTGGGGVIVVAERGTGSGSGTLVGGGRVEAQLRAAGQASGARLRRAVARVQAQVGDSDTSWLAQAEQVAPPQQRASSSGAEMLAPPATPAALLRQGEDAGGEMPYVPWSNLLLCLPRNPVASYLRRYAELNLDKLRHNLDFGGQEATLTPVSVSVEAALVGPLGLSGRGLGPVGAQVVPPTAYRYAFVVERARQLVGLAQQLEASLLATLEKRDAEEYQLAKARQDMAMSRQQVRLQEMRVQEAQDERQLAVMQRERSTIQQQQLARWLSDGLNAHEKAQLNAIGVATREQTKSLIATNSYQRAQLDLQLAVAAKSKDDAIIGGMIGAVTSAAMAFVNPMAIIGGIQSIVGAFGASGAYNLQEQFYNKATAASNSITSSEIGSLVANAQAQQAGLQASYERRAQEWQLQLALAQQDERIGQQQIRLSDDRLRIVGQERQIAQLQLTHAEDTLTFLLTKFTNAELYDWMSAVLERIYAYFLRQATTLARLAEQQLAFERQEPLSGLIQPDYWAPSAESAASGSTSVAAGSTSVAGSGPAAGGTSVAAGGPAAGAVDRKGLTGSARLLQDLTRLEQYAFDTNRRKQQLTKTLSLATLLPAEFAAFRQSGRLPFTTLQEWFDRDFPGHYLRIIRRVRVSVIALVPPVSGIRASLQTSGSSRVVVGGVSFQEVTLARRPEGVAYTSPLNATGLFELEQAPSELLYPFEGMGVAASWELVLDPAANEFDLQTLADVLVSIEYTALESLPYRRQVLQAPIFTQPQALVRSLSVRQDFADQWYELHHYAAVGQRTVSLPVRRLDFPLRAGALTLEHLTVVVVVSADAGRSDASGLDVALGRSGGGSAGGLVATTSPLGVASTRTGSERVRGVTGTLLPLYAGNAQAWRGLLGGGVEGEWTLAAGNAALQQLFDAGLVEDVVLVFHVTGQPPTYLNL